MTSRERLLAVLDRQKPDRVPFSPLIGMYYVYSLPEMGISLNSLAIREEAPETSLREGSKLWEI